VTPITPLFADTERVPFGDAERRPSPSSARRS